jgi:hypothetical protein
VSFSELFVVDLSTLFVVVNGNNVMTEQLAEWVNDPLHDPLFLLGEVTPMPGYRS